MGKRLLQHEAKASAMFGLKPRQSVIFPILHECEGVLTCFLVISVQRVHVLDSNCIGVSAIRQLVSAYIVQVWS